MVATREAHATDIGVAVLESGGNAIDAAVAVGFALAVTHPAAGNIGGGGFLLARFADGRTTFIDFRERAPERASRNMYIGPDGKAGADSVTGYRAAGVPERCAGLEFRIRNMGASAGPTSLIRRCGWRQTVFQFRTVWHSRCEAKTRKSV